MDWEEDLLVVPCDDVPALRLLFGRCAPDHKARAFGRTRPQQTGVHGRLFAPAAVFYARGWSKPSSATRPLATNGMGRRGRALNRGRPLRRLMPRTEGPKVVESTTPSLPAHSGMPVLMRCGTWPGTSLPVPRGLLSAMRRRVVRSIRPPSSPDGDLRVMPPRLSRQPAGRLDHPRGRQDFCPHVQVLPRRQPGAGSTATGLRGRAVSLNLCSLRHSVDDNRPSRERGLLSRAQIAGRRLSFSRADKSIVAAFSGVGGHGPPGF